MDTEIRREATGFAKNWWLFLITGIAWLLIGVLVLRFNIASVRTVGILLGFMFLGAAINEFLASTTVSGGWKFVHIALGVLFILGALWGFFEPVDTFFALASVLGFLLVLMGSMHVIGAVLSREANPLWWLGLSVGILEILLAMWVSQQFYDVRARADPAVGRLHGDLPRHQRDRDGVRTPSRQEAARRRSSGLIDPRTTMERDRPIGAGPFRSSA